MSTSATTYSGCLEWTACRRAKLGEAESGDQYLVEPFAGGGEEHGTLVAVVDGLGHGVEAAQAAQRAIEVLRGQGGRPVAALIGVCNEALRRTRGVVMNLAAFRPRAGVMSWISVGNVEGVLLRRDGKGGVTGARREYLLQRGGVVGYQVPALREATVPVNAGDVLIFATDGVRSGFVEGLAVDRAPEELAAGILEQFGRTTDDALVLVARYLGNAS
jgi:serine phosphatase RsbU (regulator of sigma subunit)